MDRRSFARAFLGAAAALAAVSAGPAEDMSTGSLYPSPSGNYDRLTTSSGTFLGRVSVGNPAPPPKYRVHVYGQTRGEKSRLLPRDPATVTPDKGTLYYDKNSWRLKLDTAGGAGDWKALGIERQFSPMPPPATTTTLPPTAPDFDDVMNTVSQLYNDNKTQFEDDWQAYNAVRDYIIATFSPSPAVLAQFLYQTGSHTSCVSLDHGNHDTLCSITRGFNPTCGSDCERDRTRNLVEQFFCGQMQNCD